MYAPPEKIKEYLENNPKKPFILCEYMHDMGNSLGGMESYIRLLDQYGLSGRLHLGLYRSGTVREG